MTQVTHTSSPLRQPTIRAAYSAKSLFTELLPCTRQRYRVPLSSLKLLFLFSLALFAFRLRSSVVPVLFSLISEILPREKSMIKSIFVFRDGSSGLAHDPFHRVIALTLPPIDANIFFITVLSLSGALKKKTDLLD
jgi:hypothetical protein